MARCTVKIMMELSSILVATHDRPHYVFTQHDLSKVSGKTDLSNKAPKKLWGEVKFNTLLEFLDA